MYRQLCRCVLLAQCVLGMLTSSYLDHVTRTTPWTTLMCLITVSTPTCLKTVSSQEGTGVRTSVGNGRVIKRQGSTVRVELVVGGTRWFETKNLIGIGAL